MPPGRSRHLYTLPEHLFFFSRTSLRRLLQTHGLEVTSLRARGGVYTLGYLVERLRKTLLRRSATATPRFPGSEWCLPLNLFDVVEVHARREG